MSVFPNKKPKLFGSGEDSIGIIDTPAVAGLAGSLAIEDTSIFGIITSLSLRTTQLFVTSDLDSLVVSGIVNNTNKIHITARMWGRILSGSTGDAVFELREGSTVLGSQDLTTPDSNLEINVDLTNVSSGSHTYTTRIRFITGGYQYSTNAGIDTPSQLSHSITVAVSDYNDTHAGSIDTAAIAGKQINAADSHTTKQTEVIP
ncbi:MAG: hypothetical protein O6761_07765 [Thaumarchaeota archaeon]|nr:hypothetical protein [Nitrososphaerota archaeon]